MDLRRLFLLVIASTLLGCGPSVALRRDVFATKPVWESALMAPPTGALAAAQAPISETQEPGLFYLADQVLGTQSEMNLQAATAAPQGSIYARDLDPLPKEIAELPATRVIVKAAAASCKGTKLEEESLSASDLRELGENMISASMALYQDTGPEEQTRLAKLQTFTADRKLTWEGLAFAYFSAYYEGKFIDRTGGKLSKPSIGFKIPSETITSALTVGLEAIYDYALISCRNRAPNPIVFKEEKENGVYTYKFETKDGLEPTLVEVIQHVATGKDAPEGDRKEPLVRLEGVLEDLQKDDKTKGLTIKKLKFIRMVSGYAADAGGTLSDLIVRSIGGLGGSFVIFGKISIGDNDTLAKIIQTTVDVTARRATETAVASFLYSRKDPSLPGSQKWASQVLQY